MMRGEAVSQGKDPRRGGRGRLRSDHSRPWRSGGGFGMSSWVPWEALEAEGLRLHDRVCIQRGERVKEEWMWAHQREGVSQRLTAFSPSWPPSPSLARVLRWGSSQCVCYLSALVFFVPGRTRWMGWKLTWSLHGPLIHSGLQNTEELQTSVFGNDCIRFLPVGRCCLPLLFGDEWTLHIFALSISSVNLLFFSPASLLISQFGLRPPFTWLAAIDF